MGERLRTRMLPALTDGRPETGPMQFGEDWPGVFIRGDNAIWYAQAVRAALMFLPSDQWLVRAQLEGLAATLGSCDARTADKAGNRSDADGGHK